MVKVVFHRATPPPSGPLRERDPDEPEEVHPVVVRCAATVTRDLAKADLYDVDQECRRRGGEICGPCFAEGFRGWHELHPWEKSGVEQQCRAENDVVGYAQHVWSMRSTAAGPYWTRWQPEIRTA